MREILFRGKRIDNGEWVEGMLVRYNPELEVANMADEFEILVPVNTKTVGQFTGLTDKNGTKIFEGDIVKYKNTGGISFNGVTLTVIGKVVYNEKTTSFAVFGKDEIGAKHCDYFPIQNIEVIGNIHDNPELLKESDNNE